MLLSRAIFQRRKRDKDFPRENKQESKTKHPIKWNQTETIITNRSERVHQHEAVI